MSVILIMVVANITVLIPMVAITALVGVAITKLMSSAMVG